VRSAGALAAMLDEFARAIDRRRRHAESLHGDNRDLKLIHSEASPL
jgi:hypothetical protein